MAALAWDIDGADWPHREASVFVDAGGLRWHVQRMGAGPSLLLLHGTGAATHSWRGLLPLLAEQFDVIAPDLPGHGFTTGAVPQRLSLPGMAADVAALLRKVDVTPEVVVGHSAGAAIAARMCLDGRIAPNLLVSLNGAFLPFGGIAGHLFSPLAKLMVMNALVPRLFARQAAAPGAVERLLDNTGSHIDPTGVMLYRKLVRNPDHVAGALRMMANWRLEPLVHDLPKLQSRLLLVAAANDRSVSPDVAGRVRDLVPGAVQAPVPGGHLVHEEDAQGIAELILKYAKPQQTQPSSPPKR
jgi:magnesium chelatase accessory protein